MPPWPGARDRPSSVQARGTTRTGCGTAHYVVMTDFLPGGVGDLWSLIWPAVAIAGLRVADVTLGVVKTRFVVHGRRGAGAAAAAAEATMWLSAAGIVFADPTPMRAIGFVVGVAGGTFVGMSLMEAAKLGTVTVRVFVAAGENRELAGHIVAERIRRVGHGATVFEGYGRHDPVHMVLSVVRRRDAEKVCDAAKRADDRAFVTVDSDPGPGAIIHSLGRARV